MGHVDHGKTLLLDAIRNTNVVAAEKGGITQHIGAYKIKTENGEITFIDTPGHEAFTAMRARGAKVTDIVVLVVAADDGVMPQTVEAIDHARAANVPVIVAINKMDLANADSDRIRNQLTKYGFIDEKWGGSTIFCEVSAKERMGLDHLLEMILLEAEMLELSCDPKKMAEGVVIEARIDKGRGPVATVLIRDGTLKVKDTFVVDSQTGKVRAMFDDGGVSIKYAPPSTPVEVLGFSELAQVGDPFFVVSEKEVKTLTKEKSEREERFEPPKLTLEDLFAQIEREKIKELPLVIKTDVAGTREALCSVLEKLNLGEKVKISILHSGVGAVTESDVMLAKAGGGMVIGYGTKPDSKIRSLAEREGVKIYIYDVIYDAVESIERAALGLLEPEFREKAIGKCIVKRVFTIKKGLIAGCLVEGGRVEKGAKARLIRNEELICETKISSLKRFKEDVKEVKAGLECGIGLERADDIREGDVIEVFLVLKEEVEE
jgi:translation initiation factor IF-2